MGGDFAPGPIVEGALAAAGEPGLSLLLVGAHDEIEREVSRAGRARRFDNVSVVDAPDVVAMDEPPTRVLRGKRGASVRVAAEAVARGDADALFSAGHTGASLLASLTAFGVLPGVDRPALAATIPTLAGAAILVDAGANNECRPHHLLQFGALGAAYARTVLGIARPRVGLLSTGEEESKGNDLTREAHRLLKVSGLNFVGNIEARDVYTGHADVIVCDGFTGNIALKVSEGMVAAVEQLLKLELSRTVPMRVSKLLWRPAFRRFSRRLDYSEQGAAPLVGLKGLCLVGHGRSSARAVKSGILLADRLAREELIGRLTTDVADTLVRTRISLPERHNQP
jgi:glycerol-3-phosphate acyltransferase PlsX